MSKRQVIEEALQAIYDERGDLVPAQIVTLASDAAHPLHPFFTWDDSTAAAKYRLGQAQALVRSVKIKVVTDNDTYSVRAWHALRNVGQDRTGYVPDSEVQENPEQRKFLLQSFKRDWNAMKRRYEHVDEFWDVIRQDVPVAV